MEASIREPNIKHFVRLLQCASRFGDELCMHATKSLWELSVTNSSKSAYCLFSLTPSFFSRFKAHGDAARQRRGVKCQLYVKASSVNAVERVDLKIIDPEGGLNAHAVKREETEDDDDDDDAGSEDDVRSMHRTAHLEVKLVYRHGITKKYSLHLQSSQFLRAVVDPESTPSGFQINARTLRDWLDHFNIAFSSSVSGSGGGVRGDSQLAWMFAPSEVRVKNFDGLASSGLSTEITLEVGEFASYEVLSETGRIDLTLPMREFKLAEQFGMDLDIFFSEATQPLTITSKFFGGDRHGNEAELFNIFCAIATSSCEAFTAVTVSASANGRHAKRSESVRNGGQPPTPGSARSRSIQAGSRGSARPRPSLSLSARPGSQAPNQSAMVTVVAAAPSQALSQALPGAEDKEPLFQPAPSQQSVRMTQQEVLDMAGVGDLDLEALMDDADADDDNTEGTEVVSAGRSAEEVPVKREPDAEPDVPAGWDDVDFTADNLHPEMMSTPRDAAPPPPASHTSQPSRARPPPLDRASSIASPAKQSITPNRSAPSEISEFIPDPAIFGLKDTRISSVEDSEAAEDDELDADEFDPTQPSGRKVGLVGHENKPRGADGQFESLFQD